MGERPFSPETLADRWGCSAEKVRRMYHNGELAGFRLGKLIRIPSAEVDRVECQSLTESSATEDGSASHILSQGEAAFGSRLARMTAGLPKLALVTSGERETPPHRTG